MTKYFGEILGWYGAIAILVAYALVSFSLVTPTSLVYQLLNLTGGVGIVVNSFKHMAYPSGILNIIWAVVAGVAILKVLLWTS